ncbi:hypothetical protein [Actinomycetospora flava]|uniref:ParE-like toxin of type II ParDE toxin-antitoxin system n=1 Tax=Actinomycetospora flava TaxID=3129232 RepID=A0ABU8M890_9PSEU
MYEVRSELIDDEVRDLPPGAREAIAQLQVALSHTPWDSAPAVKHNPDAELRFLTFDTAEGFKFIYFVIIEHAREVVLERLIWSTWG